MKKSNENRILYGIVGIILLALGLYFLSDSISVQTGMYRFYLGSYRLHSGFIIIPFIIGIILLFAYPEKLFPKIITGIGILIVFASVIAGTTFYFRSTSLYEYLIMLVGIFGGIGLLLRYYLTRPRPKKK